MLAQMSFSHFENKVIWTHDFVLLAFSSWYLMVWYVEMNTVEGDWVSCTGNAGIIYPCSLIPVSSNPVLTNGSKSSMILWILGVRESVVNASCFSTEAYSKHLSFLLVKSYWLFHILANLLISWSELPMWVFSRVRLRKYSISSSSTAPLCLCYHNVCVASQWKVA